MVPLLIIDLQSLVRILSMHDFLQLGLLWVVIDIVGLKLLHVKVSSNVLTEVLLGNRLMLKSHIVCTFSVLLNVFIISAKDSLNMLMLPPGGR